MGSEIQDMKSEIRSLKEDNKSILNILRELASRKEAPVAVEDDEIKENEIRSTI